MKKLFLLLSLVTFIVCTPAVASSESADSHSDWQTLAEGRVNMYLAKNRADTFGQLLSGPLNVGFLTDKNIKLLRSDSKKPYGKYQYSEGEECFFVFFKGQRGATSEMPKDATDDTPRYLLEFNFPRGARGERNVETTLKFFSKDALTEDGKNEAYKMLKPWLELIHFCETK